MSRFNVAAVGAIGVLVGLSCADVSRGEDANPGFMIPGPSWNAQVDKTRPGSFMPQLPSSRFVVTIAHIGPSPEDAVVKGRLRNCEAVQFRLDMLKIGNGEVDVELGKLETLAPGESFQTVYRGAGADGADRRNRCAGPARRKSGRVPPPVKAAVVDM